MEQQPIQQAIYLNNEGVEALANSNDSKAVECLTKAIQLLKKELGKPVKASKRSTAEEESAFFLGDVSASSEEDEDEDVSQTSNNACRRLTVELPTMNEDHQTFLFNQALLIPEPQEEDDDDVQQDAAAEFTNELDVHVYTSIVIFNLALSHHRRGITTGESLVSTKADKLYSMVLKLLADDYATSRMTIIVKLAAVNNLAQLRFDSGDYEQCREGLSHLSNVFRMRSATCLDDEDDMKDLLMSVLLLRAPKVAPAA